MRVVLVLTVCLLRGGRGAGAAVRRFRFQGHDDGPEAIFPAKGEFHFIRLEYTDLPGHQRGFGFVSRNGRGNGWWMQDWPDADEHFSTGVQRLTRVETGKPLHMSLTDDKTLRQSLDLRDTNRLVGIGQCRNRTFAGVPAARRISDGGRFLGSRSASQWEVFKETMQSVLPNKPISDIAAPDPVMHVLYDIAGKGSFVHSRHSSLAREGRGEPW